MTRPGQILVADDNAAIRTVLNQALARPAVANTEPTR